MVVFGGGKHVVMILLMVASIDSSNCASPTQACMHAHTHAIAYPHTLMDTQLTSGSFAEHTFLLYRQREFCILFAEYINFPSVLPLQSYWKALKQHASDSHAASWTE